MDYQKSLRNNFYWWLKIGLCVSCLLSITIFITLSPASLSSVQNLIPGNWLGIIQSVSAANNSDWTQEGHDAQRTGFTLEEPKEPWSLAWTWNGPDSNGGTGGHFYNAPQDARTVTGGGNLYVPAGASGLYALRQSDGGQAWRLTNSAFNATPAYDPAAGYLYAGGADGKLYKIDGVTGNVLGA